MIDNADVAPQARFEASAQKGWPSDCALKLSCAAAVPKSVAWVLEGAPDFE